MHLLPVGGYPVLHDEVVSVVDQPAVLMGAHQHAAEHIQYLEEGPAAHVHEDLVHELQEAVHAIPVPEGNHIVPHG